MAVDECDEYIPRTAAIGAELQAIDEATMTSVQMTAGCDERRRAPGTGAARWPPRAPRFNQTSGKRPPAEDRRDQPGSQRVPRAAIGCHARQADGASAREIRRFKIGG
jgi:hypothetical protein